MDNNPEKWVVFIITHKNIFGWLYGKDPDFNLGNYRFVHISSNKPNIFLSKIYNIVELPEMHGFIPIGDYYLESEAIFNIYKNPSLYTELDFIGFLHYDFEFKLPNDATNITKCISNFLSDRTKAHISFQTNDVNFVYNLGILADENQPNSFCGIGYNCMDYILHDYNSYFNSNFTIEDLFQKQHINMCSSFLIDVNTFVKMMGFVSYIIESRKLEMFDTLHQFKTQGHLLERYYSVFLLFEYDRFLNLMLPHHDFLKKIH